jgi:hypothetical protein
MRAAYVALANEELANNGHPTLGFINPDLYQFGISSSYHEEFHDITVGPTAGRFLPLKKCLGRRQLALKSNGPV